MKKRLNSFICLCLAVVCVACVALFTGCKDNSADWEYIEKKGTMIVGYTIYDPFAYEENNELIGFDVELAKAVADKLGLQAKFQLIQWDNKVLELNSKNIDVIWNAMTITDTLKNSIDISTAYCKNNQAVVVLADNQEKYATKELIKNSGDKIAFESGSSGALAIQNDDTLKNVGQVAVKSQIDALLEVASGTSKIAVVDMLLYDSLKTKNESIVNQKNLVKISGITFPAEEFGIGFRKGSDFMAKVESALAELKNDGTYTTIAKKYNLSNNLV